MINLKKNRQPKVTKLDENHPPTHHSKRKRKINPPTVPSSVSIPPTIVSVRGRKIRVKQQSDNDSDFDSDPSNDDLLNPKRRRSTCKDYQSTLNELHSASEKFIQSNQNIQIQNERFNHQNMTKLSNDNLHLNRFSDCLLEAEEAEEHRFFNSINSYLEQFRQRLLAYFAYMKADVYREHIKKQLDDEMELNKTLTAKVNCLENNIKALLEDAIHLLKLCTNELGIEELERPMQLITYANDISTKHKDLRSKVASLEKEIAKYDHENEKMNSILNGCQSASIKQTDNDTTYSTLLVNISKQTQQQENSTEHLSTSPTSTNHLSYLPISPNSSVERDLNARSNRSRESISNDRCCSIRSFAIFRFVIV